MTFPQLSPSIFFPFWFEVFRTEKRQRIWNRDFAKARPNISLIVKTGNDTEVLI